ncbi:GNAT family N-acetyltransferase [Geodermatophilus sp. SYSU D00696]
MTDSGTGATEVRPLTLEDAEALLESADAFRARSGLDLAEGWLVFPEALPATVEALRSGVPPEWSSHLLVDPMHRVVVGLGGFTGPPSDGVVEVGYSVAPGHRGRGHATAAVRLWLASAAAHGASRARAHTLAEQSASTAVLARLGFARVARLEDPEVGPVWRWERPLTGGGPTGDRA